uniref:ATP-dependent DNA helicase n=2 Tax=Brassica oleracea var. oleracea TaxID=109376 RepID=A0A0D3CLL8_BRAOL
MAMVRAFKNIVSYVRELKPRKDTSRIEVRIVRLWRNYNKESGNTIEMVLVDKEGTRIHASVGEHLIKKIDDKLREGDAIVVQLLKVYDAIGEYRTTPHPYKIGFFQTTSLRVFFDEDEPIESILNKKTGYLSFSTNLGFHLPDQELVFFYEDEPIESTREWVPRKRGFAIGRIAHIQPSGDKLYFLRVLLNWVRGPTSYEDIRTVDGVLYPALGLMDDDKEFIEAIKDASDCSSATYARKLFARMLVSKSLSPPHVVWEATWEYLTDDILYKKRRETGRPDMNLTIEQIKNIALTEIKNHLLSNGRSLKKWPHMPKPEDFGSYNGNRLIDDELKYVVEDQLKENERLMAMITDEQRGVYEQILDAVLTDSGGVFFLYGYGGTRKTFVYRALSSAIRSRGMIVLNSASSGIAALLLEGGGTAHSRFGIPIDADEFSTCKKMEPGSDRAELVKAVKLIVCDEAPMMSIHCFETLDRTMRDIIRSSEEKPFGGKVVVFGGDFRQILPVIPGGEDPIETMAKEVYGKAFQTSTDKDLYRHRAILTPTNDEVDKINDYMLSQLPEFLNSVKVAGMPRHCLKLKVCAPIMCLRNMDVADDLCNGTRLIVTQLLPHVIEGRIITGNKIAGHPVWIPRMFVTPPDTKFPFRIRRRQFLVTLASAMTINKSQGQTPESVGLFLPRPVFSHGQLYVALSRVKSRSELKILITGKEGKTQTKTLNVIFKQMGSDELGDRLYSGASRFLTTSCHGGF